MRKIKIFLINLLILSIKGDGNECKTVADIFEMSHSGEYIDEGDQLMPHL